MDFHRHWALCVVAAAVFCYPPLAAGAKNNKAPPPAAQALTVELAVPKGPLILGKNDKTPLTVKIKPSPGTPASACHVRVRSNVGRLSKQKRHSNEIFTFEYTLPKKYYPQFAILGATATCGHDIANNWLVVPLMGTGDAFVKSKPRSQVTLRVGETTFGPVRSDKKGEALIPIVVPPGITHGYSESKKIVLNLPSFNQICVLAETKKVKAKNGRARLWIYAINKQGQPSKNAKLSIKAKHGKVRAVSRLKKGVYTAIYHAPRSTKSLTDAVTVRLRKNPESKGKIAFRIGSLRPTKVSITSADGSYRAGSDAKIPLEIAVTDDEGSPANGKLKLASTLGQLSIAEKIETGLYRSVLTLPDHFEGLDKATVRAEVISFVPPHKKTHAGIDIDLIPADPAQCRLQGRQKRPLNSDGESRCDFDVAVRDRFENPVTALRLEVFATHGSAESILRPGASSYTLVYTSPAPPVFNRFVQEDTLFVEVPTKSGGSPLKESGRVALRQSEYLIAIEPSVGFLTNFGNLNAPLFSVKIEMSLWFIVKGLHALVDAGYFFDNEPSGTRGISTALHVLPVFAGLGYRFRPSPHLQLFASAGAGPSFIRLEIKSANGVASAGRKTVPAFQTAIGGCLDAGPGAITASLLYQWNKPNAFEALKGPLGGLGIKAGYQFSF